MKNREKEPFQLDGDPLWYKDAVFYEVHVRAFYDSDGDGIGDFRGLAEKLDYLRDLGVTTIWILPFYPSPLKDDGYDISSYTNVHPAYGTLSDFKMFLREAHRRGLRVVTELVLNHTSDQHPWFQRARRAPPGNHWRDFYVWSNTPEKYKEARIIFKDFEGSNWTWDPVANAYYWHRFYHHQPDLNYDNRLVRKAVIQVMNFWLGMGVDGLRLDAVPYLYEREGTHCENLPETHGLLKDIRREVDANFRSRMLLAEANQWPEDATAYFGDGDECHMAFHFPLMPRMFMAVRMEDRFPIIDILAQTPSIPENCQWALFLRNHDELTLEMVTDEERDYMYRVYAHDPQARINMGIRRRLHPLLGMDWNKIELMNGLLFSLPGTPVVYYGDEIGMGDNIFLGDRNGVRTPMQWTADRNAGFSRANPQGLYLPVIANSEYHYEVVNVESRLKNPSSHLWWLKRLITQRKRLKAFGRGTLEFLYPDNRKVLAFIRRYQDEVLLVVANLSRLTQYAELDLSAFKGMAPVEQFGHTEFPPIGAQPYFITLGPHVLYWFRLEPQRVAEIDVEAAGPEDHVPLLAVPTVASELESIFQDENRRALEAVLPGFLRARRWFGGKGRSIDYAEIVDVIPVTNTLPKAYITLVQVVYTEGDPETYVLPITFAAEEAAAAVLEREPRAVIARLEAPSGTGTLYTALAEENFAAALLDAVEKRRRFRGKEGKVLALPAREFRRVRGLEEPSLKSSIMRVEQSNTSIVYGDRLILKLFRHLQEGTNPDVEISAFLSERTSFTNFPPLAGTLVYRRGHGEPMSLGILQAFVPNQGDAWQYTLDALDQYFEQVAARATPPDDLSTPAPGTPPHALIEGSLPPLSHELVGSYMEKARLLGQRTAELHLALASESQDPSFVPEAFSVLYQRSIYQTMRNVAAQAFQLLRKNLRTLPEPVRGLGSQVLGLEGEVTKRFRCVIERKVIAMRTRIHGDYHLGQVLNTGKDFVIIDFEGEPSRSISDRRIKRSPLRDVACMLRSFHYASFMALFKQTVGGVQGAQPDDISALEPWARRWYSWVSAAFLKSYMELVGSAAFVPRSVEDMDVLLRAYLLEKALYEVTYELNNRPDWVRIPLHAIPQLLESAG